MVNYSRENCVGSLDGDADCLLLKTPTIPEQSGRKETSSLLEYIHVRIAEMPTANSLPALIDTGSEIRIIHRRLLSSYQRRMRTS